MGRPIKIVDLARELIKLSGYEPDLDIHIEFTGTRPGEKKIEELSLPSEPLFLLSRATRQQRFFFRYTGPSIREALRQRSLSLRLPMLVEQAMGSHASELAKQELQPRLIYLQPDPKKRQKESAGPACGLNSHQANRSGSLQ